MMFDRHGNPVSENAPDWIVDCDDDQFVQRNADSWDEAASIAKIAERNCGEAKIFRYPIPNAGFGLHVYFPSKKKYAVFLLTIDRST